jgi:hypothetical protein
MSEPRAESATATRGLSAGSRLEHPSVQALPAPFRERVLRREPFSLCLAWRRFGRLELPFAAAALLLVWREGVRVGGISVAVILIAAVVLIGSTLERRIDVDAEGLTFVPLLPIRPRQRFPYTAFKPFEDGVSTATCGPARGRPRQRAKISNPAYAYRTAGLFRRDVIETTNFYAPSYSASALDADAFIAALNVYHPASAEEVGRKDVVLPHTR